MVVTKPPGEEGGKPRKRGGSGREEERRSAAGRGEGEGAAGPTRKRHRRPGRRDEDEASRTEQQSATRQASAIPGEHERVVASRADEGRVPSFRERGKKKARGAREGRKGARKVGGGGVAGRAWIEQRWSILERRKNAANEGKQQVGWLPVEREVVVFVQPRMRRNSTLIAVTARPTKLANALGRIGEEEEEEGGGGDTRDRLRPITSTSTWWSFWESLQDI